MPEYCGRHRCKHLQSRSGRCSPAIKIGKYVHATHKLLRCHEEHLLVRGDDVLGSHGACMARDQNS